MLGPNGLVMQGLVGLPCMASRLAALLPPSSLYVCFVDLKKGVKRNEETSMQKVVLLLSLSPADIIEYL